MPLYEFRCPKCNKRSEFFLLEESREMPTYCLACFEPMQRCITAPVLRGETVSKS